MNVETLEFFVIVVGSLIIFDVIYELCRMWLDHTTAAARRHRLNQRTRR